VSPGASSPIETRRGVAQPGSAPQWGCGGRRFKSSRPDHFWLSARRDDCAENKAPVRAMTTRILLLIFCTILGCEPSQGDGTALLRAGRYEAAHRALSSEAVAGDPVAQLHLGIQYYLGLGTPRDMKIAARWFEMAAVQGNANAQLNLGFFNLYGYGIPRDHARAFGWFQQAQGARNPRAAIYLGLLTDNLTGMQMRQAREAVAAQIARRH
jgi:TPR repeat protein